jgi:hypothetical protein
MQTVIGPEKNKVAQIGGNALNVFESARHGKMTIFIRSKRVCVGSEIVRVPFFVSGVASNVSYSSRRVAVYENVLDGEQKEALQNSKALAQTFGIELEIKDLAISNVFSRLLSSIRGKVPTKTPSVSVAGEALTLLAKGSMRNKEYLSKFR